MVLANANTNTSNRLQSISPTLKAPPRLSAMRNMAGPFFRKEGDKMAQHEGSVLVLTHEEYDEMIRRMRDPEVIRRKKALFAELDQMPIRYNEDGSIEVEFTLSPNRRQVGT